MSQEPPSQPPLGYYSAPPKSGMTKGGKIALGVIIGSCIVTGGFAACATLIWQNSKSRLVTHSETSNSIPQQQRQERAVTTGTQGEVYDEAGGTIIAARDESSYEELKRVVKSNDTYGMTQLMIANRVFSLANRTPVLVIDAGFLSHTIRILEGSHRGESAIVAAESVRHREAKSGAASRNAPTSSSLPSVTSRQYDALKEGMTYDEAVKMLGTRYEVKYEAKDKAGSSGVYQWGNANDGFIILQFQNGKLYSKSQISLKN